MASLLTHTAATQPSPSRTNTAGWVRGPGATRTESQDRAHYDSRQVPSFAWQTPEAVADEALAALQAQKVVSIPGLQNKITMGLIDFLPRATLTSLVGRMMQLGGGPKA